MHPLYLRCFFQVMRVGFDLTYLVLCLWLTAETDVVLKLWKGNKDNSKVEL